MKTQTRLAPVLLLAGISFVASLALPALGASGTASLAGQWRFDLDRSNVGIQEKWFEHPLARKIKLPGSLTAQGIGDDVSMQTKWTGDIVDKSWFTGGEYAKYREPGNIKVPFWLQPEKYYAGAAWYQRDLEIPSEWQGRRVVLRLERPHWETRVWLDGRDLGSNNSLSTPHEYVLGTGLQPGRHQLTIRVDNGLVVDVGVNSHCISDHTQGNWNGIVGEIGLIATAPVWLENLQVYPHLTAKTITVRGRVGNVTGQRGAGKISLRADEPVERGMIPRPERKQFEVSWNGEGGQFEFELPVPGAKPWNEFSPALFRLEAELDGSGQVMVVPFAFRELSTQGTQFVLNGQKIFFRGTLECCIFPLTGHPPTDDESWSHVIQAAKAHGLNLIRFHSYCPPGAAFRVADSLGFYFQVETCWPNQSTTLGDGKPVDKWVYDETERILKAYGNHPSFMLMLHGNEPGGDKANAYLGKYVEHFKARDARRLWSSGSGWPQLPENQFHVTPDPRIQAWGGGLKSRINALSPETRTDYREYISKRNVPVISHEIGEWCVYPSFDEIRKYKGYLKPKNFEVFHDSLNAHHLRDLAHRFLLASGKLQALCYKEDIESALRTPGMGGFELLDLHDFPGQGTALVGVLDPFWEPKGYITAAQFSRFCNSTVPLVRLGKRVFTTDEQLAADIEVAHFGPEPLPEMGISWRLVADNQRPVAGGKLPNRDVPIGNGIAAGTIAVDLREVPAPARYKLVVNIGPGSYVAANSRHKPPTFENDWDVWVYPARMSIQPPAGVTLVENLDESTIAALRAGGKVLLLIPPEQVKGDRLGKVALGFSSIFWNTAWTGRQPPHTLGILCDPKHAALTEFPTDYHSNWQWWYLVSRAGAMILDDLPAELRPTVQVIDDWVTNRKLGLVFEARVGSGKLLVCSIDLRKGIDENPVARQLLRSLMDYMGSGKFRPAAAITPEQVRGLIQGQGQG
jgi:hypothetical protein